MNARSPIALTASTVVSRSAHDVASFALDWGNDALWRSHVTSFTVEPPGRATVGQRLVEHLSFAGMSFRTPTIIEAAEPLAATYAGGGGPIRVCGWRRVTPIDDASCRVDVHTEITMTGLLGVLAPVLAPAYRRADAADVARLASVAEHHIA